MLLYFVFAESALELVPREIWKSPSVVADSRRRGVEPGRMLLDRSLHHSGMSRLKDSEKRGRPDLVHVALLSVTGTPLYLGGRVRLFVHTYPDVVVEVKEKTRIPKSYFRFRGLVEKALSEEAKEGLVTARPGTFRELLRSLSPSMILGLSVQGKSARIEDVSKGVAESRAPCVVVGGFPHGHFTRETLGQVQEVVRIDSRPLEAHVVAARVAYEIEKAAKEIND